jgi:hypothetical protein
MASSAQGTVARPHLTVAGRNGLVDKYFYFAMSLLFAGIVVVGFSQSVDANLFHAAIPRPTLLWIHGATFSTWVAFYIFQSALVRTHNVAIHRLMGWFGVALAALMVVLGFVIAVIMGHFDAVVLHQPAPTFLSVPFFDMLAFGTFVSLAVAWRKKPALHRPLLFLATCCLLDAPFGRFDFIFNHNLYFPCLDLVILLGLGRDLLVDGRIHKVYRYALPALIVGQALTVYLYLAAPAWWLGFTKSVLGI